MNLTIENWIAIVAIIVTIIGIVWGGKTIMSRNKNRVSLETNGDKSHAIYSEGDVKIGAEKE